MENYNQQLQKPRNMPPNINTCMRKRKRKKKKNIGNIQQGRNEMKM